MAKGNTKMFFVGVALMVFVSAALYITYRSKPEAFAEAGGAAEPAKLQDPSKLLVFQGSSLPEEVPGKINFDVDPSATTVDGTAAAPKSMFMMAFNKCDASCCPSAYSCGGGCVCMTKDQLNFVGNRGGNARTRHGGNLQEF